MFTIQSTSIPTSSSLVTICADGRDIVESANKGMKVFGTTCDNKTFRECSPPRIRSYFERFFDSISKVLGVVQRTKCCAEWSEKPRVGFPPALQEVFCTSIQTLSTSPFASLNITFFAGIPFHLFQKRHKAKIPKGFRKWNCFRETGLNTGLIVSIVGTEISVTKVISRK